VRGLRDFDIGLNNARVTYIHTQFILSVRPISAGIDWVQRHMCLEFKSYGRLLESV